MKGDTVTIIAGIDNDWVFEFEGSVVLPPEVWPSDTYKVDIPAFFKWLSENYKMVPKGDKSDA